MRQQDVGAESQVFYPSIQGFEPIPLVYSNPLHPKTIAGGRSGPPGTFFAKLVTTTVSNLHCYMFLRLLALLNNVEKKHLFIFENFTTGTFDESEIKLSRAAARR